MSVGTSDWLEIAVFWGCPDECTENLCVGPVLCSWRGWEARECEVRVCKDLLKFRAKVLEQVKVEQHADRASRRRKGFGVA